MICLYLFFSSNNSYTVILLAYFVYFIRPQFLFFFILIYILVSIKNRNFYNHILFISLLSLNLLHNYFFYEYCNHIGCAKLTTNFFDNKFSDIFITSSLNYNKEASLQDYLNYGFIIERIWNWSNKSFLNILIFISTFSFLIFAYLRKLKDIPWLFFFISITFHMPSALFANNFLRYNVWHWFMTYLIFFIILDYLLCKRLKND